MSELLHTEGLCKSYRRRRVVDHVSIAVAEGEIVGLLGPNGAGKTTSFRMVVGMISPQAGKVVFHGQDVTRMPMYRRARAGMGYLAQEPSVFRRMSALMMEESRPPLRNVPTGRSAIICRRTASASSASSSSARAASEAGLSSRGSTCQ